MSRRSTHTTRKEAEHIRRASRPPSSSLSIERSECFPDCLLEISLATPWPKQTLRLATRTYSPHNNYLPTPRRLQPIYYSCVFAITSTALYPASFTQPHSHHRPSPCGLGHRCEPPRFAAVRHSSPNLRSPPGSLGRLLRMLWGQYKILRASSSRRELNLGLG